MSTKCCTSSTPRSVARIGVSALLLFLLGGVATQAGQLTFSPSPAVAGEPITATYEGVAFGCDPEGTLAGGLFAGNGIHLFATPPGCPILPPGYSEYTASTILGPLAAGTYTVLVFAADGSGNVLAKELLTVKAPPVCEATDTSLCLGGGRFEVTGEWTDFRNRHGVAHAAPDNFKGLGNYGVLWFFSADNSEMAVKVLNACSNNSRYWVFLSPASTVEYHITVRDVKTGHQKTYSNALGQVPSLTADTRAFPCSN
jgi:hypothetical protein